MIKIELNQKQKSLLKNIFHNLYIMAVFCVIAIILSLAAWQTIDFINTQMQIATIFMLTTIIVSCMTKGYFYAIFTSILGTISFGLITTREFFSLENISFFICMTVITLTTFAMKYLLKEQEKIGSEAEKEKMRSNLLRAVSHDLRTPLTSIIGASSAILENEDKIEQEKKIELVRQIKSESEWLIRMVENLLSVTRITEGVASLKKDDEIAEEIITSAVSKFRRRYDTPTVSISIPEELLIVPMDPLLIEQVLINLLENVVHHGGGASHVDVILYRHDSDAVFAVADNGKGISPEKLKSLFVKTFKQADSPVSDKMKNMGIGLSVCMSIVKAHGGKMEAKNIENGGALFRFTLPLEERNRDAE